MVLITFSSLIIIELLNVYSKVNVIKSLMIMSSISTLIVYLASITLFEQYFDFNYINEEFAIKILAITFAAWFPFHLISFILSRVFPTEQ